MADQLADNRAAQTAAPSGPPPQARAGTPDAAGTGTALRAPLGEWRGPIFWMACGALLAGLAGGAVALVKRVGVERDMMAVAATLPQQAASAVARASALPAAGPPAAAGALVLQPAASIGGPRHAERNARAATTPSRPHGARHPPTAAVTGHAKPGAAVRGKRWAVEEKYAKVFKRCPSPGRPGAVQCRRDICNGAEGKGPACKPYVRKLP